MIYKQIAQDDYPVNQVPLYSRSFILEWAQAVRPFAPGLAAFVDRINKPRSTDDTADLRSEWWWPQLETAIGIEAAHASPLLRIMVTPLPPSITPATVRIWGRSYLIAISKLIKIREVLQTWLDSDFRDTSVRMAIQMQKSLEWELATLPERVHAHYLSAVREDTSWTPSPVWQQELKAMASGQKIRLKMFEDSPCESKLSATAGKRP